MRIFLVQCKGMTADREIPSVLMIVLLQIMMMPDLMGALSDALDLIKERVLHLELQYEFFAREKRNRCIRGQDV